MATIYIEVSGGCVQGVYTDSKEDLIVELCDYDDAEAEEEDGGNFDFQATKACEELENKIDQLRQIF